MLFQQAVQRICEKIHLGHRKHHKMKTHLKKEKFLTSLLIRENCHIEHSLSDNVLFL